METILLRAIQLLLCLSILCIVHEGGHFFFARLFKTRVEKFCIFFDPWFTLFRFKPKNSETEYAIGWLPAGAYVKIAGMIDESMDTEQMKQPEQPWEFRSKKAWQRLLIMVGGVLFNLVFAIFLYASILFTWGDQYVDVKKAPLGMEFNHTAQEIGFKNGDILLAADNKEFTRYDAKLLMDVVDAKEVTVLREGQKQTIQIPEDMMDRLMEDDTRFASFRMPYVIDSITPASPAFQAGLQPGDSITALDGKTISFYDFIDDMQQRREAEDAVHTITLTYFRNGTCADVAITTDSLFKIGVKPLVDTEKLLPITHIEYNMLSAIPAGIQLALSTLGNYIGQMKYLFSKQGAKHIGGFGTIATLFPAQWDWHQFWSMTAFISIILAFMNIIPIPALDGGHVLFLLYEVVSRRKPSEKFMERAQVTGMLLLFALLIWANLNDILRLVF